MGFKVKFCDPCVANKILNVKQMTIVWHVNDLKIPHVDAKEVTKMCNTLEKLYDTKLSYINDKSMTTWE